MTVLPQLVTATSLTLTWQPPSFENSNGIIQQYVIQITEVDTGRRFTETSNSTAIIVESLHPFYSYNCRVAAETIEVGPYSSPITVQLNEDGRNSCCQANRYHSLLHCFSYTIIIVPTAPPILNQYYAVDPSTLYLSWSAPSLDQQNGIIRQYDILLTELETGSMFSYFAANTNHTITMLHPDYQYQIEVSTVTIGAGPSSEPVVLQMPEDGKVSGVYQELLYLHIFVTYLWQLLVPLQKT